MKHAVFALLPAILLGCSDKDAVNQVADPSKLSEELEHRATEIEEKAEMAVVIAEREAGAELASLREAGATEVVDQESAR